MTWADMYLSAKSRKKKSEAGDALIEIINFLENRTSLQVQADWEGEFRNTKLAIELKQWNGTLPVLQ